MAERQKASDLAMGLCHKYNSIHETKKQASNIQKDRQPHIQTDRQTHRDRQTEGQTDRNRDIQTNAKNEEADKTDEQSKE